jgi:hypothetical protein
MLEHEQNIESHGKQTQPEFSGISDDTGEILRHERIQKELSQ